MATAVPRPNPATVRRRMLVAASCELEVAHVHVEERGNLTLWGFIGLGSDRADAGD